MIDEGEEGAELDSFEKLLHEQAGNESFANSDEAKRVAFHAEVENIREMKR